MFYLFFCCFDLFICMNMHVDLFWSIFFICSDFFWSFGLSVLTYFGNFLLFWICFLSVLTNISYVFWSVLTYVFWSVLTLPGMILYVFVQSVLSFFLNLFWSVLTSLSRSTHMLIFDCFFYRFPSTFFFSTYCTPHTHAHTRTQNAPQVFGREEDTFTAVPSHLYYMMREVLKNSCRATVEHGRRTRPGEKLPPVKVRASKQTRTNGHPFLGV